MKKIKIGIIGFGWWGKIIFKNILKIPSVSTKYIYDTNYSLNDIKRIKNLIVDHESRIFNDKEINSIFVLSPNNTHTKYALLSAKANKNVFIEKPVSMNLSEALKIKNVYEKKQLVIAVGHNVRHYNIFKKAKQLIKDDLIGQVILIEANRSRPIGFNIIPSNWRYYKNNCFGGPLTQMGIHLIDTIRYILDFSINELNVISKKEILKTENPESFSIQMVINKNCFLNLFTSYIIQETFYCNFYGTKGSLFVDPFNGIFYQKKNNNKRVKLFYKKNNPELDQLKLFFKCIADNTEYNNPSINVAIDNLKIINKILEYDKNF